MKVSKLLKARDPYSLRIPAIALCLACSAACSSKGPIFYPGVRNAYYTCDFFLNENVPNVHEAIVPGRKMLSVGPSNNQSCRWHTFVFDDAFDEIKLIVTDPAGIRPGEQYPIRLTVYGADGQPRWSRIVTVSNDQGFTVYTDESVFKISGGDYDVPFRERVVGTYRVEQTDRRIQAQLFFRVNNPLAFWASPDCGPDCG